MVTWLAVRQQAAALGAGEKAVSVGEPSSPVSAVQASPPLPLDCPAPCVITIHHNTEVLPLPVLREGERGGGVAYPLTPSRLSVSGLSLSVQPVSVSSLSAELENEGGSQCSVCL